MILVVQRFVKAHSLALMWAINAACGVMTSRAGVIDVRTIWNDAAAWAKSRAKGLVDKTDLLVNVGVMPDEVHDQHTAEGKRANRGAAHFYDYGCKLVGEPTPDPWKADARAVAVAREERARATHTKVTAKGAAYREANRRAAGLVPVVEDDEGSSNNNGGSGGKAKKVTGAKRAAAARAAANDGNSSNSNGGGGDRPRKESAAKRARSGNGDAVPVAAASEAGGSLDDPVEIVDVRVRFAFQLLAHVPSLVYAKSHHRCHRASRRTPHRPTTATVALSAP